MLPSRDRSTTVSRTLETIDLDALVRRASEVHATFASPHLGDVAGVAAELQGLGLAIERVQQR
jgi:hypothetical protein